MRQLTILMLLASAASCGRSPTRAQSVDMGTKPTLDASTPDARLVRPVYEVTFCETLGVPLGSPPRFSVARVRTDGTAFERLPELTQIEALELPTVAAPIRDYRRSTARNTGTFDVPRIEVPGRGAFVPFTRRPGPANEAGVVWLGLDGAARLLYYTPSCPSCPNVEGKLSVGPEGRFAALTRDNEVVLMRTDGALFANGRPHRQIMLHQHRPFGTGHAISSSSLYITTGGQVTAPHWLWQTPLLSPSFGTIKLPMLSDGSAPSWISGAEGLAVHRGPQPSDLIAFTAARPLPQDAPVGMPREDVMLSRDGKASKLTAQLSSYGAAPTKLVFSPSGAQIALERREQGWPEVWVFQNGAAFSLQTRKNFKGSKLVISSLHFVDEGRLLVEAGTSDFWGRHLYLVELSPLRWRALSHDIGLPPPFSPPTKAMAVYPLIGPRGRVVSTIVQGPKGTARRWFDIESGGVSDHGTVVAAAEPLQCGQSKPWLLFDGTGASDEARLVLLDLDRPVRAIEIKPESRTPRPTTIGLLTCSQNRRYVAFTTPVERFPLPSREVFLLDLEAPTGPALRKLADTHRVVNKLFVDDHWVYISTDTELLVMPLDGSALPRVLHSSTFASIVVGSRPIP
jgi:hypothetical protein